MTINTVISLPMHNCMQELVVEKCILEAPFAEFGTLDRKKHECKILTKHQNMVSTVGKIVEKICQYLAVNNVIVYR